jgi:hypothetical protein
MDNTLALIILPMLRQLKDSKYGAPNVDDEDVPENLRSTSAPPKINKWDIDANHFKRWDYLLDEMIYAFECEVDPEWEDQFRRDDHTKARERRINALRLFGKYYHSLWD